MRAPHLLPLTGIRFCAAAWVVAFHYQFLVEKLLPILKPLAPISALGYEAVPLFFLLSGFVLSHNYFGDYSINQHPRFVFLRFARLWPVHVATFLLMVGDDFSAYSRGEGLGAAVQEICMVRSWHQLDMARNYPAWSISAEWLVYLCIFPLAVYLFRPVKSRARLVLIVAGMLAAQSYLQDLFPGKSGSAIFLFLAGSALYRLFCITDRPPAAFIASTGLLLGSAYLLYHGSLSVLVLYTSFCLVIFGLAYERGWLARALSTRVMVQGGLISYSMYMTHALVIQGYFYFISDHVPGSLYLRGGLFLALVGVVIGAAWVCYHYLEVPANQLLRRLAWTKGEEKPKAASVSATQILEPVS